MRDVVLVEILDADAEVEFDDSAGACLESETVAGEWITSSNFNRGRPPTKKEVSFSIVVPSGTHVTTSTSCIPALVGTWQKP